MTGDNPTRESDCECACHVSSGTHRACTMDAGYGAGCGPHAAADLTPDEPCDRCYALPGQPHEPVEGDCILPHSHTKKNHPPRARIGWCCQGCVTRHEEWVAEIVELYASLDAVIFPDDIPDEANGEYQKPRKAPASPSPLRLDAWALLRRQGNYYVRERHDDGTETIRHAYLGADLPDVPVVLAAWAEAVYDEKGWGDGWPTTVSAAAAVLRINSTTLAMCADVDTYDAELKWVRKALRAAHGKPNQRQRVGVCPTLTGDGTECGGSLYPDGKGEMSVWCQRCGRRFGETMLRLLGGMMSA